MRIQIRIFDSVEQVCHVTAAMLKRSFLKAGQCSGSSDKWFICFGLRKTGESVFKI